MKKLNLLMLGVSALTYSTFASSAVNLGDSGVSLGGSVRGELELKNHNQGVQKVGEEKAGLKFDSPAWITLNIDGKHESKVGNVVWRLAQRAVADVRYDKPGEREAWVGLSGELGTFKIGNQFSNFYLAADSYGAAVGMWSLFSDYGSQQTQYTRSLFYETPVLSGVKLQLQTDIGGVGESDREPGVYRRSFAYEVVLNYDTKFSETQGVEVNLGYYQGKNDGTLNAAASAFNGKRVAQSSKVSALTNTASTILATVSYKVYDFDVALAYKHNLWNGELDGGTRFPGLNTGGKDLANDQVSVKVVYELGFGNVGLGYQFVTKDFVLDDTKTVVEKKGNVNSIHLQYNHYLSDQGAKGAAAYFEARHAIYSEANTLLASVDGRLPHKKDVSRVLVGFVYPF